MRRRTKQTLSELLIYGEIFWRYFKTPEGAGRAVDRPQHHLGHRHRRGRHRGRQVLPSAVHAVRPLAGPAGPVPIRATLVIRQIPADQIDHFKINSTSSEKRGRSELFPILGYLLRFKEFVNDRILLNKMRAMFALDVAVEGGGGGGARRRGPVQRAPGPAAVLVHNKAIEVEFKNANTNAERRDDRRRHDAEGHRDRRGRSARTSSG